MAGSQIDSGGVSKLVGQLRSASSTGERNLATVNELLSDLDAMKDQIEGAHESLRSGVEDLATTSRQEGDETESAIGGLSASAEAGAGERLPGASEGLSHAVSSNETSYEGERERIDGFTETLRDQGFGEMSTELASVRGEESEATSSLSTAFSELEAERETSLQELLAAAADMVEQTETSVSVVEGETTAGLEADAESAASLLESQAVQCEQDAAQIGSQLQEAYGQWSAEQEQEQERMRTTVSETIETVSGALLEAAMDQLDAPCSGMAQNHVPTVTAELQDVAGSADEWQECSGDLSTAAGELDRGHDARRRLNAVFEGGGS